MVRNEILSIYLPQNIQNEITKFRVFFCYGMVRNGIPSIFIFRGIFRVPRNIFFSKNGNPIPNSALTHVQIFNDDVSAYLFPSLLNFFPFSFFFAARVPSVFWLCTVISQQTANAILMWKNISNLSNNLAPLYPPTLIIYMYKLSGQ